MIALGWCQVDRPPEILVIFGRSQTLKTLAVDQKWVRQSWERSGTVQPGSATEAARAEDKDQLSLQRI